MTNVRSTHPSSLARQNGKLKSDRNLKIGTRSKKINFMSLRQVKNVKLFRDAS
jgi:hypothetical protein